MGGDIKKTENISRSAEELQKLNIIIQKSLLSKTRKGFFAGILIFSCCTILGSLVIITILLDFFTTLVLPIIIMTTILGFVYFAMTHPYFTRERNTARISYYVSKFFAILRLLVVFTFIVFIINGTRIFLPLISLQYFWTVYILMLVFSFGSLMLIVFLLQFNFLNDCGKFIIDLRFFGYHMQCKRWDRALQLCNKLNYLCRQSRVRIGKVNKVQSQINEAITKEMEYGAPPGKYSDLYTTILDKFSEENFPEIRVPDIIEFLQGYLDVKFHLISSSWWQKWGDKMITLFSPTFTIGLITLLGKFLWGF